MQYVTEFAATIPNASPSMRLDHLAGRPSEVDVINGAVVELSRELGLEAPYNESLCAVLRAARGALQLIHEPPRVSATSSAASSGSASGP